MSPTIVPTIRRCGALLALLMPCLAQSAVISFAGPLDLIEIDEGSGVYAGVPLGTQFTGEIDDETFGGFITDGTTRTDFNCCIAAGGIEITNNELLDADSIAFFNSLLGNGFFAQGHSVDLVNVEGDIATTGGGRIEVGLTHVLDPSAFNDASVGNYPFDPNDVYLTLFFILEQDSEGANIYRGLGQVIPEVPLPATTWLMLTAFLAPLGAARRRLRHMSR